MNDWEQHISKYNRKERSLSILCTNFLILYNRAGVELIKLDDAALRLGLGVKRRRLYDIVNILEALGVLKRKANKQYTWKGLTAIPLALQHLKEEGLIENSTVFDGGVVPMTVSNEENNEEETSNSTIGSQTEKSNTDFATSVKSSTHGNRRDRNRTLAHLTQCFVKLFVCSNVDMISLDDAAKLLPGNDHKRTIARSLYDIVNILCCLNIIEKTYTTSKKSPAFRWLGPEGKTQENQHSNAEESERRVFGTDITNIVSRCPQFGLLDPAHMIKVKQPEKKVHDWESLAVYHRPLYQNQDLKILFSHYMEAYKLWHSKTARKM